MNAARSYISSWLRWWFGIIGGTDLSHVTIPPIDWLGRLAMALWDRSV